MADQIYNLTQTGAEVQAIINDANNAKGAGATTSLSTDYIMLKDTSGQYHKIQKDSFTEAVRNTLASLLVNNDKGTTISQIAAIASGDFGSVTPANLASVLGGTYIELTNQNLDDYKTPTLVTYYANGADSVTNKPSDINPYNWLLYVRKQGVSSRCVQYFHCINSKKMYFREYDGSSWFPWKNISTNIPDFYKGYSSLAELKAALDAV